MHTMLSTSSAPPGGSPLVESLPDLRPLCVWESPNVHVRGLVAEGEGKFLGFYFILSRCLIVELSPLWPCPLGSFYTLITGEISQWAHLCV